MKACRSGVRRCHLISYQEDGALLQELFSRDGIGTQIVMESAEQIRRATINDIGGILELIRPLEQQRYSGAPFSRTAGDGNRQIHHYSAR